MVIKGDKDYYKSHYRLKSIIRDTIGVDKVLIRSLQEYHKDQDYIGNDHNICSYSLLDEV